MPRSTPETLAQPLLGGPRGQHLAAADPRHRRWSSVLLLALLGLSALLGTALQAPCLQRGWEMPGASFRMCASPIANAMLGTGFPQAPGRAESALLLASPATNWLVDAGLFVTELGSGGGVLAVMAFALVLNTVAMAAAGVALLRLSPVLSWTAVAFLSPVIMFSMGASLDPVGVALVLWAVILAPQRSVLAGALLALAAWINPLALLVLAALVLVRISRRGAPATELLGLLGAWAVLSGLLLIADPRGLARLRLWWAQAVDRGSPASILAYEERLDPQLLAAVSLGAWALAILIAVSACAVLGRTRTLSVPAVATVLLGLSLILLPAAPVTHALWVLPFAALAVPHLWIHISWAMAEASLAIAVHLADVTSLEPAEGLAVHWLAVFTLLRLCAVVLLVGAAAERLIAEEQENPPAAVQEPTGGAVQEGPVSDGPSSAGPGGQGDRSAVEPLH